MRPNIFTARSQCAEDLFSHGLAYVLSLLPHLGDRIASRIAVLSGRRPDYFGRFENQIALLDTRELGLIQQLIRCR